MKKAMALRPATSILLLEGLESRLLLAAAPELSLSPPLATAAPNLMQTTTTLSAPRSFLAATTAGTKALFAGGGLFIAGDDDTVDVYDNSTDQWSTARLSQARNSLAATTVGNLALFAGGDQVMGAMSVVVDI